MKKSLLKSMALVAMLFGSLQLSAKQYCHEELANGTNKVYLSAEMPTDGNYVIKIEADVEMQGLGGSFVTLSDGNHDLRDFLTKSADNKTLTLTFTSTAAPNYYTPLYVLMPGEVAYEWPKDIEYGVCEAPAVVSAKARINAYGLNVVKDGDNYKFTYKANIDGTEANLVFYNAGVELDKVAIDAPKAGENNVTVAANDIPAGENLTWAVELKADPVTEFANVFTSEKTYNRLHATVDNYPESDNFGTIYMTNNGAVGKGIFIYNPDYTVKNTEIITAGLTWGSPARLDVDAYGKVWISDWADGDAAGVWIFDPANPDKVSQFFDFTSKTAKGQYLNGDVEIGEGNPAVGVFGEGENMYVYVAGEEGGTTLKKNGLNIYHVGQTDGSVLYKWNKAPTVIADIQDNAGGTNSYGTTSHGVFMGQNRSKGNNAKDAYAAMFYDKAGQQRWNSDTSNYPEIDGCNGSGLAVSWDEKRLAMIGGSKNILVYDITWNEDVPTLTLAGTYEVEDPFAATLDFDYAGNLVGTFGATYAPGTMNAKLRVYAIPTNNNTTIVPAKKALTVTGTKEAPKNVPNVAAPVPTWPAAQVKSLYSDAYDFAPASLNSYNEGWWDNPTLTEETIAGDKYLHYNGRMTGMIGWQFASISVTTMEYLHIDVWTSDDASFTMGPTSPNPAGDNFVASYTLDVKGGKWNSFDIPLADLLKLNENFNLANVFQNQFIGYAGKITDLSVDNVYFYRTTPLKDETAPTDFTAVAGDASFFSASIKAKATEETGAVTFTVYDGENVVATSGAASGEETVINIAALKANTTYKLSVVAADDAGNKTAAIEVEVKTLATPAAAPAPTYAAEDVLSVYSEAYTPVIAVNTLNAGWWSAPLMAEGELAEGNKALYYYGFTEGMIGWEYAGGFDATDYPYFHVDIYPLNAGSIEIYPVGAAEIEHKTITLEANKWNQVEIDYTAAVAGRASITQQAFINYYTLGSFFIDNLYFSKTSLTTDIENVDVKSLDVKKVIEDGTIYIIKDGVKYTVTGQIVK